MCKRGLPVNKARRKFKEQIQVSVMYTVTHAMNQNKQRYAKHAIPSEAEPFRTVLGKRKFDSHWSGQNRHDAPAKG
jgi:hypothetical protein